MSKDRFELVSPFQPTGDQPEAIDALVKSIETGNRMQTLKGVTGSGKTFTMANIIQRINRPTLVLAHNKTAGGAAVQRVQGVLPEECCGILCELLRLLPAGSLHRLHRYLH